MRFFRTPFLQIFLLAVILVVGAWKGKAYGQHIVSGVVISSRDSLPIPHAIVSIPANDLWAPANEKGQFRLKNVPVGNATLSIRYLGFVTQTIETRIVGDLTGLIVVLQEDNLKLHEVTVTGHKNENSLSTSYVMDRIALDHMQMLSITDATSLLPGGKTNRAQHLASGVQNVSVNGSSRELGNAVFGVGVEIDGVRLSGNGMAEKQSQQNLPAIDVRNIASSNIESVEVISGVASVEYGDATNGIVRINSRKGASPFILDLVTKPNTKQVALSKGLDLKRDRGVLNFNMEHTRSVADLESPYTTYTRNGLSLNYSNAFGKQSKQPWELNIGLTGNVGGFHDGSDPDRFVETYRKSKDNVIRGNVSAKWLLNKSWITNLEFAGTVNYNDQLSEVKTNRSASASVAAIHSRTEGYFVGQPYALNPDAEIILIEPGYWYEQKYTDSKLLNHSSRLKATLSKRIGNVDTRFLVGGEYTGSGNLGRGDYYGELKYAPDWREYRYDELPFTNNFAGFVEEKVFIPGRGSSGLDLVGGLRWDATSIKGSAYGLASNFSPRMNAEYTFWKKSARAVEDLSVKIGWGKSVKLPSFGTLFPVINYRDILTFAPGTTAEGSTYYAYYSQPSTQLYNPDLKWQSNNQLELGLNMKVRGVKLMVVASRDKTFHAYDQLSQYAPFTYKFTDQSNLENSLIPIVDRIYGVDRSTGVVTVSDKTGVRDTETLAYKEVTRGISTGMAVNGSPVIRKRLQWILDFKRIPALRTQFRVDGNWYYYKGVEETVRPYMPNGTINMADGNPYKYIGFFTGGSDATNGSVSKTLNLNLTATTHIPAIRLIVSTRIEGSLQNYGQALSESSRGSRGFVLDSRDSYTSSDSKKDIYAGNQYIGVYPEYYVSLDDMSTKVPFAEKFLWAKDHDKALYNELAKIVTKSTHTYIFNESKVSSYFSANVGVTKEIGRIATITFNATNFISNMGKVRNSLDNTNSSLFGSSRIPGFYYGLSLRLKL